MISLPIPLDGLANLTYNTMNNRITTAGFEYDSAGNQTRSKAEDGTWLKYEYDAANRLKIVKKDDNTLLQSFQYGSTNARLMDLDYQYGYLKIFVSVGGTTLSEYTEFAGAVPTWTKSYIYLGSSQLSTITPNGSGGEMTEYNHPDRLGIRTVTNQTAGTSYEQTTLPFGTALNAETSRSESKRFTSYERSARTGLDYAVNRTYDSKLGRFTQVDPIKMSAVSLGSPQTLNLYSYCGNDPVNHVDPDGLFFGKLFKWIAKVFRWVSIAVSIAVMVLSAVVAPGSVGIWAKILGILLKIHKFVGIAALNFSERAISIGYGIYINATLSGVGAVANAFQDGQVELSGEARQQWETSVARLLVLLKDPTSKCYKFLKKKGFDPDRLAKDLETQKPLDGLASTNIDPGLPPAGDGTPKGFFDEFYKNNIPADAVTAGLGGNIYYGNARGGITTGLVLHESLHRNFPNSRRSKRAISDDNLGRRLGAWRRQKNKDGTYKDSSEINKTLEEAGCK